MVDLRCLTEFLKYAAGFSLNSREQDLNYTHHTIIGVFIHTENNKLKSYLILVVTLNINKLSATGRNISY